MSHGSADHSPCRARSRSASPPASASARAFCIPPAKPIRADPIPASSCKSPATMPADLPVPGQKYTFGIVKAAQARGDFQVLAERNRRALRVHLGAGRGRRLGQAPGPDQASPELRVLFFVGVWLLLWFLILAVALDSSLLFLIYVFIPSRSRCWRPCRGIRICRSFSSSRASGSATRLGRAERRGISLRLGF